MQSFFCRLFFWAKIHCAPKNFPAPRPMQIYHLFQSLFKCNSRVIDRLFKKTMQKQMRNSEKGVLMASLKKGVRGYRLVRFPYIHNRL